MDHTIHKTQGTLHARPVASFRWATILPIPKNFSFLPIHTVEQENEIQAIGIMSCCIAATNGARCTLERPGAVLTQAVVPFLPSSLSTFASSSLFERNRYFSPSVLRFWDTSPGSKRALYTFGQSTVLLAVNCIVWVQVLARSAACKGSMSLYTIQGKLSASLIKEAGETSVGRHGSLLTSQCRTLREFAGERTKSESNRNAIRLVLQILRLSLPFTAYQQFSVTAHLASSAESRNT